MGTSTSGVELAGKLQALEQSLHRAAQEGVEDGAGFMVGVINANIAAATGGTMRLSGTSKRGQAISATYDLLRGQADNPGAVVKAKGSKFQLIERDTSPHRIQPKATSRAEARAVGRALAGLTVGGGGRRTTGTPRRVLAIPGIGPKAYANHPGTRGKHPFERGVTQSAGQVPAIFGRQITKAMSRVF